jgi:uncharacterized membrane protein YeaQ/YmgE (transglycosylase-associated protein family)
MTFAMFVTWVLVGVLAGVLAGLVVKRGGYGLKPDIFFGLGGSIGMCWLVRAVGLFPDAGIVAMAFVAGIGAVLPIVVQRMLRPTTLAADDKGKMWKWGFGVALVAALAWMILGPTPQPTATAATIEDKTYPVTLAALKVKSGIVTSEMTDLKVMERVEKGSDRIATAAKLTGILRLKNTSTNQTVRLIEGKLLYIDAQGQPIKLEDTRAEPTLKFGAYGNNDRLDPGQEAIQSLDAEFPAEALKARKLKEIRVAFVYIPSPYREETVNFAVSIGAGK